MSTWRQRRRVVAAGGALAAALSGLSGCAELMLVSSATSLVKALPSAESHWVETNRLSFAYAAADVFALLEQEVQVNGRTIVGRDLPSRTLYVSYPFSLLRNRWGGTMRIVCTANDAGTTVTIFGDGRDVPQHVRAIGDEMLTALDTALRRMPRTL